MNNILLLIRYVIIALFFFPLFSEEPVAVFLTWEKNPQTSIVVNQIYSFQEKAPPLQLCKEGQEDWTEVQEEVFPIPLGLPYKLHRAKLSNLEPDTNYLLKTDKKVKNFRTLPNSNKELRFIVAGDLYSGQKQPFIHMAKIAAEQAPHFAVLGGDLAYAHEKSFWKERSSNKKKQWIEWLQLWSENMVTPDGYLIPIIPVIGNHDTIGHNNQTPKESPIYYTLFTSGFGALDINDKVSILTLDSGHTHPINGAQAKWLNQAMKERCAVPFTFAIYHVPAWPSSRKYSSKRGSLIRKHWIPSFDCYELTAAFEHHEHTYKRTHPIRNNQIDTTGTLYLGNGGFGVSNIREAKNIEDKWYLEKTAAVPHFFLVKIIENNLLIQAINSDYTIFDQVSRSVKTKIESHAQ